MERERRKNDPDLQFEIKLSEIRRKARAGEFPDELIDKTISKTMCDPNSYVRRYALSKYGFVQSDLTAFEPKAETLAQKIKTNETVFSNEIQKVVVKLKKELKQQKKIIRGYLKFKDTAGYLRP